MSQQSISSLNIPSLQNKPLAFQQTIPPAMQGVDQEKLRQTARDTADNNYITNRARASKDTNPFVLLGVGAGIWYLITQSMEKFNKLYRGDFEKSIGGKIGAFGDKISNTWLGKKVGGFLDFINKKADKMDSKVAKNGSQKHKIVYTLRHHATRPEWGFAKAPGAGMLGFLAMDTEQVVDNFLKDIGPKAQKLTQYGLKPNDYNKFLDSIRNLSEADKLVAIQKKELELLGADTKVIESINKASGITGLQKYSKHLKLKNLNVGTFKEYDALKGKFLDNPEKVQKMLDSIAQKHPEWNVSIWQGDGGAGAGKFKQFLHKVRSHLFGREVNWSEYSNKWRIATGKGAKSRLGVALQKSLAWIQEGASSRFAGGKFIAIMQAGIFADMLIHVYNSPKGEKIKTMAERLVNDFSYFVAMTLGIVAMHKVGGFKYAGLDDKGREEFRKALEEFNKKVDAKGFATKKEYKAALKELYKKLGTKNIKNPITRLLHYIGRFINMGNERVHSYKSNDKNNLNLLRKLKNGNIIGVPMRILIPIALITPIIVNATTKTAHKIFGRPTNSVLDEDKEEETATPQQNQPNAVQTQTAVTSAVQPQQNTPVKNPQDYQSDTNLIKNRFANNPPFKGNAVEQQQVQNPPYNASSPNLHPTIEEYQQYPDTNYIKMTLNGQYPPVEDSVSGNSSSGESVAQQRSYVPSPDSVFKKDGSNITTNTTNIINQNQKDVEPIRTYIPSPEGKVTDNVDLTPAEKALADADNAEKFINDTLSQM